MRGKYNGIHVFDQKLNLKEPVLIQVEKVIMTEHSIN